VQRRALGGVRVPFPSVQVIDDLVERRLDAARGRRCVGIRPHQLGQPRDAGVGQVIEIELDDLLGRHAGAVGQRPPVLDPTGQLP
jgi:hypothetical protein